MAPCPAQERREEDDDNDELGDDDEEEAPSHLPLAPPSQSDDISTTVDPSYIISLIRRLLPHDARAMEHSQKIDNISVACQGAETYSLDQNTTQNANSEATTIVMEGLHCLASHDNMMDDKEERVNHDHKNSPALTTGNGMSKAIVKEKDAVSDDEQIEHSDIKDPWEDCGCILWDLSASRDHAEFMVNNLLLEVLLENLRASKSCRVIEIGLGIIGNLACHCALNEVIVSKNGLIEVIVDQLFLDDSTCLSETFRLLAVSLQGSQCTSWAAALLPEQVLSRILWIVGNTLNSTLLERCIEFLLAVIHNQEVARILLGPLTELDLPNLIVGLLTCEMSKLRDENRLERSSILDMILRLVEALSAIDSYSEVFSSHEEFYLLVCGMVKLPDKIEVASSCVSAVVVIANLLVDDRRLTSVISQDFPFLRSLFDMFPFVSGDPQARNALWCILARLLVQVQENDISKSTLHQFISLFLDKFNLIEEDLKGHPMQDSKENSHEMASSLRIIACILEKWIIENPGSGDESVEVHRLLKYLKNTSFY